MRVYIYIYTRAYNVRFSASCVRWLHAVCVSRAVKKEQSYAFKSINLLGFPFYIFFFLVILFLLFGVRYFIIFFFAVLLPLRPLKLIAIRCSSSYCTFLDAFCHYNNITFICIQYTILQFYTCCLSTDFYILIRAISHTLFN